MSIPKQVLDSIDAAYALPGGIWPSFWTSNDPNGDKAKVVMEMLQPAIEYHQNVCRRCFLPKAGETSRQTIGRLSYAIQKCFADWEAKELQNL